MRCAGLEARPVAVWGGGREGRAALAALRRRFPDQPLVWIVTDAERAQVPITVGGPVEIRVEGEPDAALTHFEVVVKSPGISLYRPDIVAARRSGVRFTSGTAIWFAEHPRARTICVTGTKGKSTTAALIAHLLRAEGVRTALAGNIGFPLLDLEPQAPADWHVIELSSFQTADLDIAPDVAVLTSLAEEHLDWHGDVQRYRSDKLRLFDAARTVIAPPDWAALAGARTVCFGRADGWHVVGDHLAHRDWRGPALTRLPLPGRHNADNACAALAALDAAGFDARAMVAHLAGFRPLPHRLQVLGERDGVLWVNDSIATTPAATLAAWQWYRDRPLALILGGHERGLDWSATARALAQSPPKLCCTQGSNGPRIAAALREHGLPVAECADLDEAVARARSALDDGGVVVLSPGAPSFPAFGDYTERGRAFAAAAGYDPVAIGEIDGLGVA